MKKKKDDNQIYLISLKISIVGQKHQKEKKMQYDRANIRRAYDATLGGMSVYKASILYMHPSQH